MQRINNKILNSAFQIVAGACAGIVLAMAGIVAFGSGSGQAKVKSVDAKPVAAAQGPTYAQFGRTSPSPDVRYLADWVADSGDSRQSPFLIIDKKNAKMYVFDATASLVSSSVILLGRAKGDDTVPGIGSRPIEQVKPEERTTPAGRFVGERGHDARGEDVVWVDYDAAVSIHRVLTTNPAEHRLQRLATSSIEDKRISYGCINVPKAFYEEHVKPMFAHRRAIIYVLPETKPLQQFFNAYDVHARFGREA